jgi:hypothetical protein
MAMYGTGIAGRVGGLTNQANLASGMGANLGTIHTGQAGALSNVYGGVGNAYMDEARSRAGILSQIGQTQAQGIMGAANAQGNLVNQRLGLVGKLAGLAF